MSSLEAVLLIATAFALGIPFWRRLLGGPRWLDYVPAALVVLMLLQIAVDGFHAYMGIAYVIVVLLFLLTLIRMIRPNRPVRTSRWRTVLQVVGIILGLALLLFGIWSAPVVAVMAGLEDLSEEQWMTAFDLMHDELVRRYAYTEWKQVDWDALYAEFAPRIAAAEETDDVKAYHLALREYAFSIPDGHVILSGDDAENWQEFIGGGYGLAVIELDDDTAIVHVLQEGGPAQSAGMTWGAEILEWEGVPIGEAIGAVSPIWTMLPPATQEGRRFRQQALLTRAPVGTQITVMFRNPGQDEPRTVKLTAVDDGLEPLYRSLGEKGSAGVRFSMGEEMDMRAFTRPPEYEILAQGYGYIKVYHESPEEGDPDFVEIVEQAVLEFTAQSVPGIIIDVRGNGGGQDWLVPQMMGYFVTEPDFYEYIYLDNWQTGLSFFDFAVPLKTKPREPHYAGPIAVLIDQYTLSTGEGFPMVIQRLPQGHVVGVYGTYGSFGMCCAGVKLPGDCQLAYPMGQSLDSERRVQLDGDHTLQGGVAPDIRVPLTRETVYAMYVEGKDVVLEYAIDALRAHGSAED
jgi:carboxyl-terminal processing protease